MNNETVKRKGWILIDADPATRNRYSDVLGRHIVAMTSQYIYRDKPVVDNADWRAVEIEYEEAE